MRPIALPQSALRAPLNAIFGTEANVRILRVLVAASVPVAPVDVGKKAMVNLSGALRALSTLEELGIIERVGSGRRQPVALRRAHPLAPALESLFAAEQERFQRILERLKEIIGQLSTPPKSAWIEGAAATQQDRTGEPLRLALLTSAKEVDRSASAIAVESLAIQQELDVTIEVRGLTLPDLRAMSSKDTEQLHQVLPVFGPPPSFFLGGWERVPVRRSHAAVDDDARAMAAAIAVRLKRDPSIAERSRRYIRERLPKASPPERRELREWDSLLSTMSAARLRRFLVDSGQRATRLRQTMPFLAVLTPEERARISLDAASNRRKAKGAS